MEEHDKNEVEKIIEGMTCPKDFICYRSGFTVLCKAKDIGIESFIECQEEDAPQCVFSFSFGYTYLCRCPLRIYIAKKLGK